MSPELAIKLIEKGVIRQNTEIDAYYRGIDISGSPLALVKGNFMIVTAKQKDEHIFFEARNTEDGSRRTIDCADVVMIDGMEPSRFAGIYGLNENGLAVKQGKRRGRKPKISQTA